MKICSDDTDERDIDFNVGDCNKILPVELIKMLEDQYSQLMSNGSYLGDDEFKNSLKKLQSNFDQAKESVKGFRTAKFWIMFMELVSIAKQFIRAEMIGDWSLHMKSTYNMLPYFTAAGHNNYAKCARLYYQEFTTL